MTPPSDGLSFGLRPPGRLDFPGGRRYRVTPSLKGSLALWNSVDDEERLEMAKIP
jgi:hypothetical protein